MATRNIRKQRQFSWGSQYESILTDMNWNVHTKATRKYLIYKYMHIFRKQLLLCIDQQQQHYYMRKNSHVKSKWHTVTIHCSIYDLRPRTKENKVVVKNREQNINPNNCVYCSHLHSSCDQISHTLVPKRKSYEANRPMFDYNYLYEPIWHGGKWVAISQEPKASLATWLQILVFMSWRVA